MSFFQHQWLSFLRWPDFHSIRLRLAAGVVVMAVLGIGGSAGWMGWRMHQILVAAHKQAVWEFWQRFEQDVAIYEEMMSPEEALTTAIERRILGDKVVWVRSPQGELMAQSETFGLNISQGDPVMQALQSLPADEQFQIVSMDDRAVVLCVRSLEVNGRTLGTLFIANDITQDQRSLHILLRNLALVSGLVAGILAIAIILYVQRSLRPLQVMSRQVTTVTAASLNQTRLTLDRAPTELKELADAFDTTLERLSQAWEQQRRLVGDVSHELRTPLTLVQGYLQSTLRRCNTLTEPQRDGLETAAAETERTIHILQDLLVLARASNGHLYLNLERVDLKTVVLESVAIADYLGDRVEVEIQTAPLLVRADPSALRQSLSNLITNAMNYSPPHQRVYVKLRQEAGWALIRVQDKGRGISPADHDKIFEPFYRVDADRSRATGGTGLGLSIVKNLVEKMGGKIDVKSKLNEGSTFTLRLPLCRSDAP
jgi:signal transduction histidine kinase